MDNYQYLRGDATVWLAQFAEFMLRLRTDGKLKLVQQKNMNWKRREGFHIRTLSPYSDQCKAKQCNAKQSKAMQSNANQSKAKQSKTPLLDDDILFRVHQFLYITSIGISAATSNVLEAVNFSRNLRAHVALSKINTKLPLARHHIW
jgi:hypothetical protein